jgi:penicillin-binding protein 2
VQTYEPYGPVILATDLTPVQTARLAEAQSDLPGVDMEEQPVRNYPYGKLGAHLFGYVGIIDEDEYNARKRQGYSPNDVVGKDGLENYYDSYLHGRAGGEQVEVNAAGALVRRLKPLDPVPGDTLVTTLDWHLQKIVEKNLRAELKKWGGRRRLAGAVVVIDPSTGGILAMASYPEFNPNDFATPINERIYGRLLADKLNPLYDRAIGAASPTGSTFKMVTGSGAISSGVIKPNQVLYDSGAWNCHGVRFVDIAAGGLGSVGFVRALAASSDGYFYQLGYRLGHDAPALLRAAIRHRLTLGHRPARRISRQLADRRVDRENVRPRLSPRTERRLPARHRPRRDASHAAADGQRHRHRRRRRHPAIARTSSPRSARRWAA